MPSIAAAICGMKRSLVPSSNRAATQTLVRRLSRSIRSRPGFWTKSTTAARGTLSPAAVDSGRFDSCDRLSVFCSSSVRRISRSPSSVRKRGSRRPR